MSGEVRLTSTLNKDNIPVTGQPQLIYALLEIVPSAAMANIQMALNVSLVLDASGSMSGEKIKRLKDAVKFVIDQLGPDDYISVVRFASSPTILVGSQLAYNAADKQALKRKVDGLDADGGTDIAPAMRLGLAEIKKQMTSNRISRMVLLTDGDTQNESSCLKMADESGQLGVPVIALGIGTDWKEKLLQDIAARSGGQADYIAKPQEISQFFQSTVQAMQAAVVQNAVLTLRLVAGVTPRKVWRVVPLIADLGFNPITDRAITVPLGELEKDQGQALLVELMLPPRQAGNYRVAQAEIAYDAPLLNLVQAKERNDIMLGFTPDPNAAQQVNPRVMNIVEKVTAFKLQTRALQEAEVGNIAGATQKLRAAATILLSQGDTQLAQTANLEADKLEQQGQMTNEGKKTIRFGSGKTVKLTPP
jgi:Ca-activated chloride channel family protein